MRCPYCGHKEDHVVDSRSIRDGSAIRRRRECLGCEKRFTTYEYVEIPLMVRKRDGRQEAFDRTKLRRGIALALTKRPVKPEIIDTLVAKNEENSHGIGSGEISSEQLGELVMERLRETDEVAYLRFASVYRRFEGLREFQSEIEKM